MLRCVIHQVKPSRVEDRAESRTPPGRGSASAAADPLQRPGDVLVILSGPGPGAGRSPIAGSADGNYIAGSAGGIHIAGSAGCNYDVL
jgi:hypothetical protein